MAFACRSVAGSCSHARMEKRDAPEGSPGSGHEFAREPLASDLPIPTDGARHDHAREPQTTDLSIPTDGGGRHEADVSFERPTRRAKSIGWGFAWAAVAPLVTVAIGKALFTHAPPGFGALLAAALFAGPIAALFVFLSGNAKKAHVSIADRKLTITFGETTRVVTRDAIVSAFVGKNQTNGERLELELQDGERLFLDYPKDEAARSLEALALDPKQHRSRIPLYTAEARVTQPLAGGFLGLLMWLPFAGVVHDMAPRDTFESTLAGLLALATTVPFFVGGWHFLKRALHHVVVGAEGVEWTYAENFKTKTKHVPFTSLLSVTPRTAPYGRGYATSVTAKLTDGTEVLIAQFPVAAGLLAPTAAALVREIEMARRAFASGDSRATSALLEATHDGSWLKTLRELAASGDSYRGASLSRERLLALLDDPRARPSHRIGAAVILAERNDDEGMARIRVAADTTASPRVRVAFESVARGEIEERALAEAVDDERAEASIQGTTT